MESRESEWLRHLAVSLWLRVPDEDTAFARADGWAGRIEDEVMGPLVRRTRPSVWEPGPDFEGSGLKPKALPNVVRLLHTMGARGSVGGRRVRPGRFAEEAAGATNAVGGSVTWSLEAGRTVGLRFSVWALPVDPDQPGEGHELQLSCQFVALAQAERDAIAGIAHDIAQRADLTYGQIGSDQAGVPTLLQAHPASLGPCQGWQVQRLRGYDWVTMIPPGLAAQIDQAHLDYGREHLHRVDAWDNGGLFLQATATPETYTMDAVHHVFRTVAQALPEGAPQEPARGPFAPKRPGKMLVYADPADQTGWPSACQ